MTDGPDPNLRAPHISLVVPGNGINQIPIAAGPQTNYWGAHASQPDIRIALRHEQDELDLEPGRDAALTVEVYNYGSEDRHLRVQILDFPESACHIPEPSVVVASGHFIKLRVILRCAPTAPLAGPGTVSFRATDLDSGDRWDSDRKTIRVRPKPAVELTLASPVRRTDDPTIYLVPVRVANVGNTDLEGTLALRDADQPADAGLRVRCEEPFHIGPDQSSTIQVYVQFDNQPFLDRRYSIPLRPMLNRDDLSEGPDPLSIIQQGILTDIIVRLIPLIPVVLHRGRLVVRWSRQPVAFRLPRGMLAAAIVLGVVVIAATVIRPETSARSQTAPGPATSALNSDLANAAKGGTEIAPYQGDWPGLPCAENQPDESGLGQKCDIDGIELYLWIYGSHDARNRARKANATTGSRPDVCAAPGRQGTWVGSHGRGGSYVEYSILDRNQQCWARIWWDTGDSDPQNRCALLLSAKWDKELHNSWDLLRIVWVSHGYRFSG